MIIFDLIYIAYADLEASGGWRFQPPNPENLTYKKSLIYLLKIGLWHLRPTPANKLSYPSDPV